MGKYIKVFNTHSQYEGYTADTQNFILPNVSVCKNQLDIVHYNPLRCDETSVYDIVGTPSYPATIDGDVTYFDILVHYERTDIDLYCNESVVEGTDTVRVECGQNPSTSSARTVSGTVDYYGNEIEYSVTQNKMEYKVTAKFNITDTSSPTQISYDDTYDHGTTSFTRIEIDGVELPRIVTAYTFSTTGEHTVKYYLKDTTIGKWAFHYCSAMTSCVIDNGIVEIGDHSFSWCKGLASVGPVGSGASVEIPNSVTTIGKQAFYPDDVTNVIIPDGVINIGYAAFYSCINITNLVFGNNVTTIGEEAFYACRSLTSVTIPDNVTSIGVSAFRECSHLTSVTISSGTTNIGGMAFYTTPWWNSYSADTNNHYGNIVYINNVAYRVTARTINSATFKADTVSISDAALASCSALTNITIPDTVEYIGDSAFIRCSGLTSVTIGSGVTSIGSSAFTDCSVLTSITVNATTPPTLANVNAFNGTNDCPIYVPADSVDTYKAASGWSSYASRIQAII